MGCILFLTLVECQHWPGKTSKHSDGDVPRGKSVVTSSGVCNFSTCLAVLKGPGRTMRYGQTPILKVATFTEMTSGHLLRLVVAPLLCAKEC